MRLPFEPPIEPMLAAPGRDPGGASVVVRAQVGRLSVARLPRRRRALPAEPRPAAPRPLLPGARGAAAGRAPGALRRRRRDRDRRGRPAWTSTRSCSGSTRPNRAYACSPPGRRPASWPGTSWPLGDEDLRAHPFEERRSRLEAVPRRSRCRACTLTPSTRDASLAGRLVRPVRGRRPRRRHRQAPRRRVRAGRARLGQGQARPHRRRRGRRVPLAQGRGRRPASGR